MIEPTRTAAPAPVADVLAAGARGRRGRRVAAGHRDRHVRRRADRRGPLPHPRRRGRGRRRRTAGDRPTAPRCSWTAAGWRPTTAAPTPTTYPAPPAGEVTVTGWVRADGDRRQHRGRPTCPTRAISSAAIGAALDRDVYGGFVDLESEDPSPADGWSPPSCPTSATARTSSTGCSGGSSGCWRSSASATSRTTSGGGGPRGAGAGAAKRRPRSERGASRRRPAA